MQINSQFLKVTCIKKLFSKVAGFSWYLLKLEKKDIWLENFFAESIFSKNGQFQKIEISFDFSLFFNFNFISFINSLIYSFINSFINSFIYSFWQL